MLQCKRRADRLPALAPRELLQKIAICKAASVTLEWSAWSGNMRRPSRTTSDLSRTTLTVSF